MKLKRSVQTKIFFGFISMLCSNVIMLILCLLKINDTELDLKISFITGGIFGYFLERKINIIQYDEYDNNDKIFFIMFVILLALLIMQSIFLSV